MKYSKNFPALRAPICYEFHRIQFSLKIMKKQWYIQKRSALRALICYEFLKKLHEKSMIFPKIKMEVQLKLMD